MRFYKQEMFNHPSHFPHSLQTIHILLQLFPTELDTKCLVSDLVTFSCWISSMTASKVMSLSRTSGNGSPEDGIKVLGSRKVNKQKIERRRRARINNSLTILKALVVGRTKPQEEKVIKLEKTDILDATVSYVQKVHQQQSHHHCFNEGYQECFTSVIKFFNQRNCSISLINDLSRFLLCGVEDHPSSSGIQDPYQMSSKPKTPTLEPPPIPGWIFADSSPCNYYQPGSVNFCEIITRRSEMSTSNYINCIHQPLDLSPKGTHRPDLMGVWRP